MGIKLRRDSVLDIMLLSHIIRKLAEERNQPFWMVDESAIQSEYNKHIKRIEKIIEEKKGERS